MSTILRIAPDCTGRRTEIWCAEDPDSPISLPGIIGPKEVDRKVLDTILALRATTREADAKRAAVDAALSVELQKRKAAVGDLSAKTPTEVVAAIFPRMVVPK